MSRKHHHPEPETLGLPQGGVDSHCHMDLPDFDADRGVLLDRARACGLTALGNVFLGPEAYAKNRGLFADRPDVFFILGIHPDNADTCTAEALTAMRSAFAADPRLKAVGEIGLDHHWDVHPPEMQAQAFRAQLRLALQIGRPPAIHCRDAFDEGVRILREEGFSGRPVLWHCFSGDMAQAETLLDQGWHISIGGRVSYHNNTALREAAAMIPLDRLLLETDCPYLTPDPWRGKRNHPALVAFTALALAKLRNMPVEDLWAATGKNARDFFALKDRTTR